MATPITLENVSKHYPALTGGGKTRAVDGASMTVEQGELFFLLGPSGCGKTTLLRIIAGFVAPTKGRVLFGDKNVTGLSPNKRDAGMVFQSYALWPHMTVESNVAFGLKVRKVSGSERRRRVAEALELVGMSDYAKRKPTQLSGGQQQRVALARAIVVRPRVLLLDEPLSNLDAKLRFEMRDEIRRICKESGITAIYVTHDQSEALSIADRIAVMNEGRVEQVDTPEGLYRHPKSLFVTRFIGETNIFESCELTVRDETPTVKTPLGSFSLNGNGSLLNGAKQGAGGGRCTVAVRPEAIRLSPPLPESDTRGRVLSTTYLGFAARYSVAVNDGRTVYVLDSNPHDRWGVNEDVRLEVNGEDLIVLPE